MLNPVTPLVPEADLTRFQLPSLEATPQAGFSTASEAATPEKAAFHAKMAEPLNAQSSTVSWNPDNLKALLVSFSKTNKPDLLRTLDQWQSRGIDVHELKSLLESLPASPTADQVTQVETAVSNMVDSVPPDQVDTLGSEALNTSLTWNLVNDNSTVQSFVNQSAQELMQEGNS